MSEHESPVWYEDHVSFMPEMDSPKQNSQSTIMMSHQYHNTAFCKKELENNLNHQYQIAPHHFLQLPLLENPKLLFQTSNSSMPLYGSNFQSSSLTHEEHSIQQNQDQKFQPIFMSNNYDEQAVDQMTDWRVLDKFVASQLSHEDVSKENEYSNSPNGVFHSGDQLNAIVKHLSKDDAASEIASTSTSTCQIDLWK